jgi:pimeloyl-ACP methyl ester carboxylesterase
MNVRICSQPALAVTKIEKGRRKMNRKMKTMQMLVVLLMMALLLVACGTAVEREAVGTRSFGSQEANVEEVKFQSGGFRVVGDLRMPAGEGPHPAIIMVHGDGAATRNGAVQFGPMIEIFLRNGYSVFSWDKPGSGESTGQISNAVTERAEILADGIAVLAEHPRIDPGRIGLWGISQAGWVMPLALELRDDVAFMIVVSGGAEDGIEQGAYMISQQVLADGGTEEEAALVERYWAQQRKARDYDEYREAVEVLMGIPTVTSRYDLEIREEKRWKPVPRDWDMFIDPMDIIEHTTIPVLAIYGEKDTIIDPVQGAEAYEAAFQAAGNTNGQIVVLPNSAHVFTSHPEYQDTMETWLQHLSQ